jgi:4-carboxymuconolactone decarboxylase
MRFPRLDENAMSDAQRRVAAEIASGPRGELRGPFVPLIHSPELASHIQRLGAYIRFGTGIGEDVLEIAILHVARHSDCPNIWESHRRLAIKAGVPRAVIGAIARRERPENLGSDQALVVTICKELLETNMITDATFERAVARWGRKGVMDLTALCGYYGLLAMVLNVSRPPLEPGSAPFEA